MACAGLALGGASAAVAAPVSVGHSGWSWGSPTPQGKDLNNIAFVGSTGYAVGDFGTVLKSTDGGATWSGLPSGTLQDLNIVQELDANTVIVGGGCALEESTNGGASFQSVSVDPPDTECTDGVSGASFTSASTGFVEQADSGQILFTDDGGQTVEAKTSVPLGSGDGVFATALQFLSPTVGFATTAGRSGTIQRTTDSANSWTQVGSSANGLNALTFVNPTTAYAVGDKDTLLASTNGGASWTARPLALPAGTSPGILTHISCSDALNCLISIAQSRSLIRTTNGGETGSTVTPSSVTLADVAFSTGTDVVGVGGGGATVLSADGGVTFPTLVSGGSTMPVSNGALNPLRPGGTATAAYLLGRNGQLEATTDGGLSWTVLRTPSNQDVDDAAFPTTTDGYAITDDHVLRKTVDGGTSWSSSDAGVPEGTALIAPGADNVLLVGPVGIRRSTDGGQTFTEVAGRAKLAGKTKQKGPAVASLKVTEAVYEGHTAFVANNRAMYESTDGGAAWRVFPLPAHTKINDLSFVSATTGYVADAKGDLLFTHNRGATWTRLFTVGTRGVQDISFSSASTGVIALDDTASPDALPFDVLATTNGAKTWQPEVIDGGADGLVLATAGHTYYADSQSQGDDASAVFSTTNLGASPQASRLTISIGAKTLTAAALKKRHQDRVTVTGQLTPVLSQGEQVLVSWRNPNNGWSSQLVNVASSGAFQVTIKNLKSTTDFVVYAVGNGVHGGAGAYARLTVK